MQPSPTSLASLSTLLQATCKNASNTGFMTGVAELKILGGVALHRDGEALPLGGPKAQLMLSMLIAHRESFVSTDRLVEALWHGEPPKSAVATVQSLVSRLRSVLNPDFTITYGSGGYRLRVLGGGIDAAQFEALLRRSRTTAEETTVSILVTALSLWHGPAFGSCADEADVRGEAVRLNELKLVATDAWAEARMATGDPAAMVGELESLVTSHPLRECYWRLLMLALYRTGRQAEALRRANEFRAILRTEVGLDLSPLISELEAQILADDPALLVESERSRPTVATNTGSQALQGVTSFVGRDPDLAALSEAIGQQPLITITGPGGVGKTRLALRVASAVMNDFDDGVAVVEFAALRDPSGTAQVIAQALDIQQRQHRTIEATLAEYLAPAHTLLVLDNCEHVTETLAPLIDQLRSSCPKLRILATSRHSLGLAGEHIEVLAPLSTPPAEAVEVDEIRAAAAVELFVARAAATIPGFALTVDNAIAIADICRRLEGLPLALELAAARLRTMGIVSLSTGLNQRIELLGQTQRGADGRQRTLYDLVKWSYDLLTLEERHVFEQLAVFAGGFDLPAAEAVCTLDDGEMSFVGHVSSLVDKSMVVLNDRGISRYQLLEPLREFGLGHLRGRDALEATEDRHLRWFVERAEQGAIGLDSPSEATWSSELLRDFDNYRVAHLTAVQRGDADSALRLVNALREFSFRRVNYEIVSWADRSSAIDGASDHPEYTTALAVAAYGAFVRGDRELAIDLAEQALNSEENSELSETGLPERVLGNVYFYLEQNDEALRWLDRMLLSARRSDASARITHGLYMTSIAYTAIGDGIRGALLAGEAKAASAASGSPTSVAMADLTLGLALEITEPAEALTIIRGASLTASEAGNRWIEAFALTEVHSLEAKQGDLLVALTGYSRVIDLWFRGGDWANQWLSLRRVLGILVELNEHVSAAVLHGALTAVGAAQAMPIGPAASEHLSQSVEDLQSFLGPIKFANAVRLGASMKDREIIDFVQEAIADLTADTAAEIT